MGRSLREAKLIRESPLIRWVACHGQPEEEEDDSIGGTTGPMIKAVVMRDVCRYSFSEKQQNKRLCQTGPLVPLRPNEGGKPEVSQVHKEQGC